jgi:hypothetical protein
MYDDLIKRLNVFRLKEDEYQIIPVYVSELIGQAADAIEELSRSEAAALEYGADEHNRRLALEQRYRWIPVKERLPEADEYDARGYAVPYLVMNGWMRVTARRTKDYWVLFGDGAVLKYVTHWMPLPEPPKEE